jgi:hypothetical protein
MDMLIEANILKVAEILEAVGFKNINVKNAGTIEAKLKDGWGRIHVLGAKIDENNTYLDVHRDAPIHIAFIGVDYIRKPKEICEKILQHSAKMGIKSTIIGGTSWFNRKNRAILRGVRL